MKSCSSQTKVKLKGACQNKRQMNESPPNLILFQTQSQK
jgi:hypothetical protein